jgi:hypothetical protein
MFMNWRPKARTWLELEPYLKQMDEWGAVVGLGMRTGVADHYAMYTTLNRCELFEIVRMCWDTI